MENLRVLGVADACVLSCYGAVGLYPVGHVEIRWDEEYSKDLADLAQPARFVWCGLFSLRRYLASQCQLPY